MGSATRQDGLAGRLRAVLHFARQFSQGVLPSPEGVGAVARELAALAMADAIWWGHARRDPKSGGWRVERRGGGGEVGAGGPGCDSVSGLGQVVASIDVDACLKAGGRDGAAALHDVSASSPGLREALTAARLHAGLVSVCDPGGDGRHLSLLWVARQLARAEFDAYDAAIVQVAHEQVAGLMTDRPSAAPTLEPKDAGGVGGSEVLERLTPAQRTVLPYLVAGFTEAEIAKMIYRSRYTVHDHARAIYSALGVRSRVELVHKVGASLEVPAEVARAATGGERP